MRRTLLLTVIILALGFILGCTTCRKCWGVQASQKDDKIYSEEGTLIAYIPYLTAAVVSEASVSTVPITFEKATKARRAIELAWNKNPRRFRDFILATLLGIANLPQEATAYPIQVDTTKAQRTLKFLGGAMADVVEDASATVQAHNLVKEEMEALKESFK